MFKETIRFNVSYVDHTTVFPESVFVKKNFLRQNELPVKLFTSISIFRPISRVQKYQYFIDKILLKNIFKKKNSRIGTVYDSGVFIQRQLGERAAAASNASNRCVVKFVGDIGIREKFHHGDREFRLNALNRFRSPYVFLVIRKTNKNIHTFRRYLPTSPSVTGCRVPDFSDEHTVTFRLRRAVLRVTGYRSRSRLRPPAGVLPLFGGRKRAGTGPGGRRTAPSRARRRPPPGHGVFPRTRTTHRPPRNTLPPPSRPGRPPLRHRRPIAFRRLPSSAGPLERKNTASGGHSNDKSRREPGNRGLNRPCTTLVSERRRDVPNAYFFRLFTPRVT